MPNVGQSQLRTLQPFRQGFGMSSKGISSGRAHQQGTERRKLTAQTAFKREGREEEPLPWLSAPPPPSFRVRGSCGHPGSPSGASHPKRARGRQGRAAPCPCCFPAATSRAAAPLVLILAQCPSILWTLQTPRPSSRRARSQSCREPPRACRKHRGHHKCLFLLF